MTIIIMVFSFVIFFVLFGFSVAMIFSPKLRGKMMSKQIKAMRYATDESKRDIEQMGTNVAGAAVNIKKNVLDENADVLKEMATTEAEIQREAIKTKASAIREGLFEENSVYCKHCGASIDSDSKFCKKCGKEQ